MAIRVSSNTIPLPTYRDSIERAVLDGIGQRPPGEDWTVSIFEPQDRPDYIIRLKGPNNFTWEQDFFGPTEQTPEFIRNAVKEATTRPAPVDYEPVIERLLQKSEQGKVTWEKTAGTGPLDDEFVSTLEVGPGHLYRFCVKKADGAYALRMTDAEHNEIFSVSTEETVFGSWRKLQLSNRVRDIFELARRKSLAVDQKLSEVASLLDAI